MATEFAQVYADSAAKMYADTGTTGSTIVPMAVRAFAAARTADATFMPGPGPGKGKFNINRRKRVKRKASDKNAAHGTRFINRLNAANKVEWETVTVLPGEKYDFLVNVSPGDASNFATNPGNFLDGIETAMDNTIIQAEETAIENILADAAIVKISLGDLSALDLETWGEKLFNSISLVRTNTKQFVDDYKHMSGVTTHASERAGDALRAYKGTAFNVTESRYADDIVPNFTFNNNDMGLINSNFDKFTVDQSGNGGVAGEHIVAIVMDDESYFDSGFMNNMNDLNTKLLDENYNGFSYWAAAGVIDAKRITVITGKIDTDIVVKVND